MKIEIAGTDNYNIFINNLYIENINYNEKEEVTNIVKKILMSLKNRLKLRGFYKVKVFPNDKLGLFLELIKLEDLEFSNNLDLRIIVYFDEKIFFETEDYFIINDCNEKRFLNGNFYCIVDDKFDMLLDKIEFGRFVYGKEVIDVLNKSIIL